MSYQLYQGFWRISFLEADGKTVLPRQLHFASDEKIRDLHARFGSQVLEDKQALSMSIENGRGGIWLTLSDEEYAKLRIVQATRSLSPPARL